MILIGDGPVADAKARLLERGGARIVGEKEEAALAIVVDGDEATVIRLKARGLLVNVVDRPELCDFTLPAIVDRDPVLIAVGTGGASAGLAAALRQRIEALLPGSLGKLADALFAARDNLRARFPEPDQRRRSIGAMLAAGGPLDPLGDLRGVDAAIAEADVPPSRVEQLIVASSDPDALTLRAARLLGVADRLYQDGQIPSEILDRARADAERIVGIPPTVSLPGLSVHLIWTPQ